MSGLYFKKDFTVDNFKQLDYMDICMVFQWNMIVLMLMISIYL